MFNNKQTTKKMNNRLQIEKEVKDVIERDNLPVSPEFVIGYWSNKNWKTKKGTPVKSFDIAVHVCNSIYVQRMRKNNPHFDNRLFQ